MRVKVSSTVGLFCAIGCVYQIYGITKSYLQFKVRHDVVYDFSTSIELPAIDIMVPMIMAENLPAMLISPSEEMQKLCEILRVKYEGLNNSIEYSNKNCEEIFILYWLEQDPIVLSHYVLPHTRVIDIRQATHDLRKQVLELFVASFGRLTDHHCKFTRFYNGVAIFMRIFCLNGTKPFSVNTNYVSWDQGIVASLKYAFGPYFGIRFSDHNDLPVYDPSKYFMIIRKPGSFPNVTISFVKTVMSSLEYPYETSCRHYNKDKSISKCMTEYTLGLSPPYLDKYSVREWDEQPEHLDFNPRNDDPLISQTNEVNALINCKQQAAATECEKTSYSVEGKTLNETKREYGLIFIKNTWKANVYLSVHPVLPWSQYVIFIGSILGIWFGISMRDHLSKLLNHITTIFHRRLFGFPSFLLSLYLDR